MRCSQAWWLAAVLVPLAGCEGATCDFNGEPVPAGYCGNRECNGCQCTEDGLSCTLVLCEDWGDRCRATGLRRRLCQRHDELEPCDAELSARDRCHVDHGACQPSLAGDCRWVDRDGMLGRCLANAD